MLFGARINFEWHHGDSKINIDLNSLAHSEKETIYLYVLKTIYSKDKTTEEDIIKSGVDPKAVVWTINKLTDANIIELHTINNGKERYYKFADIDGKSISDILVKINNDIGVQNQLEKVFDKEAWGDAQNIKAEINKVYRSSRQSLDTLAKPVVEQNNKKTSWIGFLISVVWDEIVSIIR